MVGATVAALLAPAFAWMKARRPGKRLALMALLLLLATAGLTALGGRSAREPRLRSRGRRPGDAVRSAGRCSSRPRGPSPLIWRGALLVEAASGCDAPGEPLWYFIVSDHLCNDSDVIPVVLPPAP
jgi:hypothetical protein